MALSGIVVSLFTTHGRDYTASARSRQGIFTQIFALCQLPHAILAAAANRAFATDGRGAVLRCHLFNFFHRRFLLALHTVSLDRDCWLHLFPLLYRCGSFGL